MQKNNFKKDPDNLSITHTQNSDNSLNSNITSNSNYSENSHQDNYLTKSVNYTYYHPLEDLDLNKIKSGGRDKILKRENKEIKVLTYNIFLRPPLIKNNENDWKDERLADFVNHLVNFDVICLQEMFGTFTSRKQMFIRAATLAGFFFFVDTGSPSFSSKYLTDGGLLILSRFPIEDISYFPFPYGVISDSIAEKGIIYAKIKIQNSYLHLFTTHLQASYFGSSEENFVISFETRMQQIKYVNYFMIDILKNFYDKNKDKILLVGDFNVDAFKYQYSKYEVIIAK